VVHKSCLTELVSYNLRFPGQYYDIETGNHYNYFRDYVPSIGRYLQSDPVGLLGGPSTYAYVSGQPLALIDPMGLAPCAGHWSNIITFSGPFCSCAWVCTPCFSTAAFGSGYGLPKTTGMTFFDGNSRAASVSKNPEKIRGGDEGASRATKMRGGGVGDGSNCTCRPPASETGCQYCLADGRIGEGPRWK
jgi:RHS repeat-associated protein